MITDKVLELVNTNDYKLNVKVGSVDKVLNKRPVVIETIVHNTYNNKWLEPRKTQLFLSKGEISTLINWLAEEI